MNVTRVAKCLNCSDAHRCDFSVLSRLVPPRVECIRFRLHSAIKFSLKDTSASSTGAIFPDWIRCEGRTSRFLMDGAHYRAASPWREDDIFISFVAPVQARRTTLDRSRFEKKKKTSSAHSDFRPLNALSLLGRGCSCVPASTILWSSV